MNWTELKFKYTKTNAIIVANYSNGKWSHLKVVNDDKVTINALSASLNYGLQAFEGLKAYRGADDKIRLFRPWENSSRLRRSADFLGIPSPPESMFIEACIMTIQENILYLPPYESGATLYLRPLLIGCGGQIDLVTSNEVMFIVAAIPVSSFVEDKKSHLSKALIARDHDRTAPMGSRAYKIGGNYAPSIVAGQKAKHEGYSALLYLDSQTRNHIDEFSSSNFFGIKDDKYITPKSPNILPSITNDSLMTIAKDMGLTVQKRAISVDELATFDQMGACGTAIVILNISEIYDPLTDTNYKAKSKKNIINRRLKNTLIGMQTGVIDDKNNWCLEL
jgi:branched-chain amino acid aminotransferase